MNRKKLESVRKQMDKSRGPTDAQVDAAVSVLRADYYHDVLYTCEDVCSEILSGGIEDPESFDTWLHESIDGNRRVIMTWQAKAGLLVSDNESYADDEGLEPEGPEQRMFWAMQQDVIQRLDADDVKPWDERWWDELNSTKRGRR